MSTHDPVILFDPYPRPVDLIFSPEDKARLERLGASPGMTDRRPPMLSSKSIYPIPWP